MTGKGLALVFWRYRNISGFVGRGQRRSGPFGDSTDRSPASTAALPVSARSVLVNEF